VSRPPRLRQLEVVREQLQQHEVGRHAQRPVEDCEVVVQVGAAPPEVEDLVPGPEVRREHVRKAVALIQPLPEREGVADDDDPVLIRCLGRDLPLPEPEAVAPDLGPLREVVPIVAARAHPAVVIPQAPLAGHEREGGHENGGADADQDTTNAPAPRRLAHVPFDLPLSQ